MIKAKELHNDEKFLNKNILCDYELCIYQQDSFCTLPELNVGTAGICLSCIQVNVDNLQNIKQAMRKRANSAETKAFEY